MGDQDSARSWVPFTEGVQTVARGEKEDGERSGENAKTASSRLGAGKGSTCPMPQRFTKALSNRVFPLGRLGRGTNPERREKKQNVQREGRGEPFSRHGRLLFQKIVHVGEDETSTSHQDLGLENL